jgi:preprotein translocase subunit SecG
MFWTNFTIDILLFLYVIDCIFMGFVIMMQRSKQEGLGAAFGQSVAGEMFGTGVSSVLVKATVWATIFFFCLSILLARLYAHRDVMMDAASPVQQELMKPVVAPAAAATTTPAVLPNTTTNSAGQPVVPTATQVAPSAPAASATPASSATPAKPAAPATK